MDIINIPQLRLGQLQALTESSLKIAQPLTVLEDAVARVQTTFEVFKAGMQKDQASSDKKLLDQKRDKLISGFLMAIKAEDNFYHTDPVATDTQAALKKVMKPYTSKIIRLPYDEQTAAVDNMIEEVETVALSTLPHLARWISPIKEANKQFKDAAKDFLEDTVSSSQIVPASQVALELKRALENMYTILFAHAKLNQNDPTLTTAYQELTALVDSYR